MTTDQESTMKAHRRYLLIGAILGLDGARQLLVHRTRLPTRPAAMDPVPRPE